MHLSHSDTGTQYLKSLDLAIRHLREGVWWVDLVWLPDDHLGTFSLPIINSTEGENTMKNLVVEIKAGRSFTSCCYGQNSLIYCQLITVQDSEKLK